MKTLPAVDVAIIGGGWTGLLMAKELGSRTALSIVVLERGGPRESSNYVSDMDELAYSVHHRMMQDFSKEPFTIRHSLGDRAYPLRQLGNILPGTGVGGAGEHWGGLCKRFMPDTFEILSKTIERYGAKRLPEDHALQDWGITYDHLEPYYTRAERLLGISGQAGNLRGQRIDGGNIFEGPRSTDFPTPPIKITYLGSLFRDATKSLGYHPYANPSATISTAYTNPDGVSRPPCVYCGFCSQFGCMIGAKAQPTTVLLPVIRRHKNVSIRTGAWVRRILQDGSPTKGQARGVTYVDEFSGEEIFQPARLVFLASFILNNSRLLLLSGIGEPYDPVTGKGSVGRNLTHQVEVPAVTMFLDKPLNRFMGAAGGVGISIDDFDADHFDHTNLPFLRGGVLRVQGANLPIKGFGIAPPWIKARWGSKWKKAAIDFYDRTESIGFSGEHMAYKGNYMDLDPGYKDRNGDPLIRMTVDWKDNERRMVEFMVPKAVEMAQAMGVKNFIPYSGLPKHYEGTRYQSTQIRGGTIMGVSPESSVVNTHLQTWQLSNLFVLGGSTMPQADSVGPTLTMLSLTLRTADVVVDRYLKNPGPLA
jgi:gluconate 2-dehydrogenase alpha chain